MGTTLVLDCSRFQPSLAAVLWLIETDGDQALSASLHIAQTATLDTLPHLHVELVGSGGGIRTHDLLLMRQTRTTRLLYSAVPWIVTDLT